MKCGILCLWLFCLIARAAPPPMHGPVTRPIPLFNGLDLTGFHTWLVDTQRDDPRGVFSVTDGMIRISGDGLGYLATRTNYANYRLVVEFRWGERNWPWGERVGKARDSGVFLHAVGPDGNSHDGQGAFMAAVECNLFQGATGDLLLIRGNDENGELIAPRLTAETAPQSDADGWPFYEKGGLTRNLERWGRLNWFNKDRSWRDVLDFRGASDLERPVGEWNRLECLGDKESILVFLNGQLVNQANNVFPSRGRILLQCEGSEILFRKVELHPLGSPALPDMEQGLRLRAGDALLFVPRGGKSPDGHRDVLLHLHGAVRTVENAFLTTRPADVLLNLTLPGLSEVYQRRFAETNALDRLLAETAEVVRGVGGGPEPKWRRIVVSSFSAGFGGVRQILKTPANFDCIDALLLADSLYCGYSGGLEDKILDAEKMEGFLRFAREAAAGRKRLLITHSAQRPEGYASTTETANYLIAQLAGKREFLRQSLGEDFASTSYYRKGGFEVLGFPGETAEDHMRHLRSLDLLLKRLGR